VRVHVRECVRLRARVCVCVCVCVFVRYVRACVLKHLPVDVGACIGAYVCATCA
jgi:hypothetical protein